MLCVVDDAQWLDRESAQALTFVARRLLADPVGLVFATRQPSADLAAFRELVVEGLRDADAQTLLSAVLHVPLDERVRDRIVAETRGNPLALSGVAAWAVAGRVGRRVRHAGVAVDHGSDRGELPPSDRRAPAGDAAVPDRGRGRTDR